MISYLSLGSNLGNRKEYLIEAIKMLSNEERINIIQNSEIIETDPYGKSDQPDFLNCIVKIDTSLKPRDLLNVCQEIENTLGRKRTEKWGPRVIDIDILFYNDHILENDVLTIPHPDLHNRKFILRSLNEIAPDLIHPILKKNIKQLFKDLK